jgi:hypothetical protein
MLKLYKREKVGSGSLTGLASTQTCRHICPVVTSYLEKVVCFTLFFFSEPLPSSQFTRHQIKIYVKTGLLTCCLHVF